eukprot:Pgem_evm1s8394
MFYPDHSEKSVVLFGNIPAPANFLALRLTVIIELCIAILIIAVSLYFVIYSTWKKYHAMDKAKKQITILLNINLIIALALQINNLVTFLIPNMPYKVCDWYSIVSLMYLLNIFTGYLIFLKRTDAVNMLLKSSKTYTVFCKILTWAVYSMGLFAVISYFFSQGKKYFAEGYCIEYIQTWLQIVFIVSNICLVIGLLILFYYPLHKLIKQGEKHFKKQASSKKLQKLKSTAKVNLMCGIFSAISTTICIISMFIGAVIPLSPATAYTRQFTLVFGVFDLVVNVICSLIVTRKVWLPKSLRKRLNTTSSVNMTSSYRTNENKSRTSKNLTTGISSLNRTSEELSTKQELICVILYHSSKNTLLSSMSIFKNCILQFISCGYNSAQQKKRKQKKNDNNST